ncbi:MAG: hypothetical protein O2904_02095 [bacterium]|nr:hypothetical protein [bacterium]
MRYRRSLGPERESVQDLQTLELKKEREILQDKTMFTDFGEIARANEFYWRIKSMQLEALLKGKTQPLRLLSAQETKKYRKELIVGNQAMTYYQYMPQVQEQVIDFMDMYDQEFVRVLPFLSKVQREHLQEEHAIALEYMLVLRTAVDDRRNYSSIFLIDQEHARIEDRLIDEKDMKQQERTTLEKEQLSLHSARGTLAKSLTPESKEALAKEDKMIKDFRDTEDVQKKIQIQKDLILYRREVRFDQDKKIIDILKGNPEGKDIPGAPKNFLPQRLYLQTIQLRYNQSRKIQVELAKDEQYKGWEPEDKNAAQKLLSQERRSYMDQMIAVTQQMAGYHLAMYEMTSIQNHFGNDFSLEHTGNPYEAETPKDILENVDKSIDGARDFHDERLQAALNKVDSAFSPNGFENLKDAGIMEILESADGISSVVRNLILATTPEGATRDSIAAWIDKNLPLAIQDSLGEGPTKKEKLQKIRDVFIRFRDTGAIGKFRKTLARVQEMPDASQFAGQEYQLEAAKQLNPDTVSKETIGKKVIVNKKEVFVNGATVYRVLLDQMHKDGEAFEKGYGTFLKEMEDLVDVRLGLIAEIDSIKEGWRKLSITITAVVGGSTGLVIAGAALGGSALTYGAMKVPKAVSLLRSGTGNVVRLGNQAVRGMMRPDRLLTGGAAVYQGYRTYKDIERLGEITKSLEKERTKRITELKRTGFESVDGDKTFTYEGAGKKITIKVNDLDKALQGQSTAQIIRTVVSATETTALAYLAIRGVGTAVRTVATRAFLPLVIAEVAIESVVHTVDQSADREFLLNAPAWLIARINLEDAIGETPYSMLAKSSGRMITDNLFSYGEKTKNVEEKTDIRMKMIFSILNNELRSFPDIATDLYGGSTHPSNLERFYEGKEAFFNATFLPVFTRRLQSVAGGKLSLEDISKGKVNSSWGVPLPGWLDSPNISLVEVRTAMRESMVYCQQLVRMSDYSDAVAEQAKIQEELKKNPDDLKLKLRSDILADIISALGQRKVFGKPASELDPKEDIGLKYANRDDIYKLAVENAGDRGRLAHVVPATYEESEAATDPDWIHRHIRPILGNKPFGITHKEVDRQKYMYAAQQVRNLLKDPKLPENTSDRAALVEMTRSAVEHVSSKRSTLRRSGDGMNPIQFNGRLGAGNAGLGLGELAGKKEFDQSKVIGELSESVRLTNGDKLYLKTYVYGDLKDPSKMYVVQKASLDVDLAVPVARAIWVNTRSLRNEGSRRIVQGQPLIMSGADFAKHQPNGKKLLDEIASINTAFDAKNDADNLKRFEAMRAANKPKVAEVHEKAIKQQSTLHKLPFGERYMYVSYSKENGFVYLDMYQDDRINYPAFRAPPDQQRIKEKKDNPPVEMKMGDSSPYFLNADYRETFAKNGIDPKLYEDALSYPVVNEGYTKLDDRYSIQKILSVYVKVHTELCEDAENNILPLYKKMNTPEDKILFLRTLNNLIQEERNPRRPNYTRAFDVAARRVLLEVARAKEEHAVYEHVSEGKVHWQTEMHVDGNTYDVGIKSNSRSKSGGVLYQPNKETDSVTVIYKEKGTDKEHKWTVWGHRFFASEKFPKEVRDIVFAAITTPTENGIAWNSMQHVYERFPHDSGYTSRLYESCEEMYEQALNKQEVLKGLFESIRDNGAKVTKETWVDIRNDMRKSEIRGDFDKTN